MFKSKHDNQSAKFWTDRRPMTVLFHGSEKSCIFPDSNLQSKSKTKKCQS